MSISGNGLWQSNVIAEVKNLSTVKSKHMESITGNRFFFLPLTTRMIATLKLTPDHSWQKDVKV